jgi:energy-coupling factor transporter ATP-binding protein EcfA2
MQGRTLTLTSDLTLRAGEVCIIFGESDPLIQEFLYLLAGLHRIRALTSPAKGGYGRQLLASPVPDITLSGLSIYSLSTQQRASQIAVIYENPEIAIIGRTVVDEFQYSFAACDIARPIGGARALEPYGLQYKVDRDTDILSGGERHRLNCACALEVKPKLIIADFTASNLDSDFLDAFLQHLGKFAKDGGIVVVAGVRVDQLQMLSSNPKLLIFSSDTSTLSEANTPPSYAMPPAAEIATITAALGDRKTVSLDAKLTAIDLFVPGRTRSPFSVTINPGDFLTCNAPNGFGKTTIANVLANRLKGYDGHRETQCKRVTLAVQHPERSLLHSTVALALGTDPSINSICGFSDAELKAHPRELTRARQKLLSVTVALAGSDGVSILDEPTCGMDSRTKEKLGRLISHFSDLGLVVFTHDPALFSLGKPLTWK